MKNTKMKQDVDLKMNQEGTSLSTLWTLSSAMGASGTRDAFTREHGIKEKAHRTQAIILFNDGIDEWNIRYSKRVVLVITT